MKKYIIILITLLMTTGVTAQTMTPQEERAINQKVYQVITDYATYASVNTKQKEERFKYLFKDGNIKITNDLMGLSYEQTLTLDEYVKLLRSVHRLKVSVKNIQKGQITDEGNVWNVPVVMDKSISFVGACGYYFDSQAFFKKDYRVRVILAVDKSSGQCQIIELKSEGERLRFPRSYRVLEKHDERDEKLTINDNMVSFNDYKQVMLRSDDVIKYLGGKIDEVTVKDECGHKIHARFSDKAFRIRPNAAFALTDFNKLGGSPDYLSTSKAGEMSFGVDVGYVFPSTGRLQTGVFVGIGMSSNTLTMEMSSNGKTFNSNSDNFDEDGDNYVRHYAIGSDSVGSITQEMKASDIAIPIYLDLEYRVAPTVSVYGDLGLKFQTSTGKLTGSTSHGYTTWGEYSKYGIKEMGRYGEVELNDFGSHRAGDIDIDETGVTKSMAIDALIGLGVRLNIGKSIAIDAGIQYQTGTKSWKTDDKKTDIAHYSQDGDGKASDKFYNFIRHTDGISHGALKATASLIVKF